MALGALPLRDEVEHVDLRKKTESACIKAGLRVRMQTHDIDKKAMQERMRMLKQHRTRSRDEKYAGRAGPPDCEEIQCETDTAPAVVQPQVKTRQKREDSMAEWDIVGADEHLHSPRSSHPPCTCHTQARCTVSRRGGVRWRGRAS